MKILMYAPIFPPVIGGPSTQVFSLCRSLHKHGEEVVVVTTGEHFECKSPDGYRVYRYPWKYTSTSLDKIIRWIVFPFYFAKILKKEKPDIVHAHSVSILSFVSALLSKLFGIPTVIKFAGDWVWETLSTSGIKAKDFDDLYRKSFIARLMWKIEKWGLSLFDYIWAPSEFRAQNIEKVQGHHRNVRIIHNSLDLPFGGYHEESKDTQFVVVSANRFIPHKRIPAIVVAFSKLENKNSKLVLIGTGQQTEIEATIQAIKELGVEDRVVLTGRLDSEGVYEYFKKSSIYVSNSLEEGFPNVFVEAMHFGLPIISTDVGGCHEIVKEGDTGFLFDPLDQGIFVEKMKVLMEDADLRNKMAQIAHTYSSKYDLNVVLDQFLNLYHSALTQK